MKEIPYIVCACSSVILKSVGLDYKIRSKVVIFKGNKAFAVCKSCNKEVEIPLKFDPTLIHPRLILSK